MKKIGLIALALVLALGVMGGALAYWNETLTINGTVNTGELDVQFSNQWSNDAGADQPDPSVRGSWTFASDLLSATWTGDHYDYDVASTTCALSKEGTEDGNDGNDTLTITINNAYPCYYGNVAFTIDNIGTIPAKIESIKIVEVSKDTAVITLGTAVDMVACTTYYVDAETGNVDTTLDAVDDFSLHLSTLAIGQPIAPMNEAGDAIPGDICIHVENGAEEETLYDFTIEIVATQFNAS